MKIIIDEIKKGDPYFQAADQIVGKTAILDKEAIPPKATHWGQVFVSFPFDVKVSDEFTLKASTCTMMQCKYSIQEEK